MKAAALSPPASGATDIGGSGRQPARTAAGEVRLIGGQWKRTRLPVPVRPGLRPTPDRVRETLFNWLGQSLDGWQVLDAYAGSGALGFEAASRGAERVWLVEIDTGLARSLEQTRDRLGASGSVEIRRADALLHMRTVPASSLDLVLLDPPFALDQFETALQAALPLLRPGGVVYLEADRRFGAEQAERLGYRLHRAARAGAVYFHLLLPLSAVPAVDALSPAA